MPPDLTITDPYIIGDNPHYRFVVARMGGDRWCGFACSKHSKAEEAFAEEGLPVDPSMWFVLAQVSEGYELGVPDKDLAIRMTGAIACDFESAYGGIDRWFVPEELRGKPDDFRCKNCGEVGCDGRGCGDDYRGDHEENSA